MYKIKLFKHCSFPIAILYNDIDKKANIAIHQSLRNLAKDVAINALSCTDILLSKGILIIFGCTWQNDNRA